MAAKNPPCEGEAVADTWVSPVPASVAPMAHGVDSPAGIDARSAARAIAAPSVRVLVAEGGMRARDDGEGEAHTTFAVGALIEGRYRIQRFIGRGGMGEVYEAHDQLMDRRVALKTILRSVADRSRAARRFKAEVRNAQRVAHPNVCRLHDIHEHHDTSTEGGLLPFFTMELIDGERLAQRLLVGALPLADARRIALQLLAGLAAAHARGVLHLDFKSDNVMLRRGASEAEAVITDFGLSRVLGDPGGLCTSDRRQFAGTLPYMSIEQLECHESLGPATDVYAFGVVLYEMLTRALPFDGDSLGAVLMKQLNERPLAPSRRVAGISPALDRFVLRCLNREPRDRFSDAGAALEALETIGSWTRPPLRLAPWRMAWPAAALLAAAGALLASRSQRALAPPPPRELLQVAAELAPLPPAIRTEPAPASDVRAATQNDDPPWAGDVETASANPSAAPVPSSSNTALSTAPRLSDNAEHPLRAAVVVPPANASPVIARLTRASAAGAAAVAEPLAGSAAEPAVATAPALPPPGTGLAPLPVSAPARVGGTSAAAVVPPAAVDGWKPMRVPRRLSTPTPAAPLAPTPLAPAPLAPTPGAMTPDVDAPQNRPR